MKKLCVLLIAFLFVSCGAGSMYKYEPPTITTVEVEPVIRVFTLEGNKDELYVRANKWMVQIFNNAKSVVQFSDKESGVVSGKYLMGSVGKVAKTAYAMPGSDEDIFAIIGIDLKDGAAKITLTPQSFEISESKYWVNTGLSEENVRTNLSQLIASFEEYMKNNTETF